MRLSFRSGFYFHLKRIIRLLLGFIFLILGILGLFLPILQGILFLVVAAILLAPDVPFIRRLLNKFKKRYPRVFRKAKFISGSLNGENDKGINVENKS